MERQQPNSSTTGSKGDATQGGHDSDSCLYSASSSSLFSEMDNAQIPMTLEACIDLFTDKRSNYEEAQHPDKPSSSLPPIISFDNLLDVMTPQRIASNPGKQEASQKGDVENGNVLMRAQRSPFDFLTDPIRHDLDSIFA